jgi:DNA mismatch repair protein MSH2
LVGNLQDVEDMLGNMDLTSSPVVLAAKITVKGDQKVVGVAFADASIREIGVSEFIDNDVYSNFEVLHPLPPTSRYMC